MRGSDQTPKRKGCFCPSEKDFIGIKWNKKEKYIDYMPKNTYIFL